MDWNREEIALLEIDRLTAIELIQEWSAEYNTEVYNELGASLVVSINNTINNIIQSNEKINGFFIMCDQLHPVKLAEYLLDKKNYKTGSDTLSKYIAHYLKRKINELYKDVRYMQKNKSTTRMSFGRNQDIKETKRKYKERISENVKQI